MSVMLTPKEEEEEEEEGGEEVLRLQEEIASSRTSQNRERNHSQCRTRTHWRLGLGLQVFHEVQRETLRVCVQPLRVLRLRLFLPWNTGESSKATRVSAVSVKAKAQERQNLRVLRRPRQRR